jgi:hypothetical protein
MYSSEADYKQAVENVTVSDNAGNSWAVTVPPGQEGNDFTQVRVTDDDGHGILISVGGLRAVTKIAAALIGDDR